MIDIIKHRGYYSIIRTEYVDIADGDACAAQILDSMERWTGYRLSERDTEEQAWIYVRIDDFVRSLRGTFKRNKVIEALKLLKGKGFIQTKSSRDPRDQTLLYKLNIEKVQTALDKIHNDREGAA